MVQGTAGLPWFCTPCSRSWTPGDILYVRACPALGSRTEPGPRGPENPSSAERTDGSRSLSAGEALVRSLRWRSPATWAGATFESVPPRPLRSRAVQGGRPACSRKNARITLVPWNPDSVGGRPIYRRPWSARRNDCFLLTHIISMSLSAYSVGSTVVGGCRLRLQLRAPGCSRMSSVIRLSGDGRAPRGARH